MPVQLLQQRSLPRLFCTPVDEDAESFSFISLSLCLLLQPDSEGSPQHLEVEKRMASFLTSSLRIQMF